MDRTRIIVLLPYTTVLKKIRGHGFTWLDDIMTSAVSLDAATPAINDIVALLRQRRHIQPGEADDFNIRHPEEVIKAQVAASRTLAFFLISVASIALLVGGIGIMNVMLVSVTERTREIGLRLAVGATTRAIQIQFLGEAVMLSLLGGLLGVIAGVARLLHSGVCPGMGGICSSGSPHRRPCMRHRGWHHLRLLSCMEGHTA